MPKLPAIGYDPVSSHAVGGQAIPATGVGQGLAQLGSALGEVGGILKDAYDTSKANAANTAAQKELQDFTIQLQNGGVDPETGEPIPPPSPDQHKELYEKEVGRINEKYQSELSDRSLRMFNDHFTEFSTRQGLTVQKNAVGLLQDRTRAVNDLALEQAARNFVEASDLEKAPIKNAALSSISDLEARGIYTPQQAVAARAKFVGDAAGGSILKIMKSNPLDVVKAIDNGEFNELPADTLYKYRNQAIAQEQTNINLRNAQLDRQERLERRAEQRMNDETFKTALDMSNNPKGSTLTLDWVHANRDKLSVENYKAAYKLASGEGGDKPSNRAIYSDLYIRAQSGEDVSAEAQSHFLRGDLKVEDWKAVQSSVESNSVGFQANNWSQNGQRYIKEAMVPTGGLATPDSKVSAADALMDWSNWVKNNPKATSEQGMAEAKRIVDQRMIINMHELVTNYRLPRFFEGNRSSITIESLSDSYNKTTEAYKKGQLSEYDYGQELKKIKAFKDNLSKMDSAKVK